MIQNLSSILAINPGSRYVGVAVFQADELVDWKVKAIKGKWSKEKRQKAKAFLNRFIEHYEPDAIAVKKLHRSRSSSNLDQLISDVKQLSKERRIRVYQYSIKELKTFFSPEQPINKSELAEILTSRFPVLFHEFNKEKANKNPYHIRSFEAVALGAICSHQIG